MKLLIKTKNGIGMTIKPALSIMVLTLLAILVSAMPSASVYVGVQAHAADRNIEAGSVAEVLQKAVVTIERKSNKNIITHLGDRYGISSEQTLIVGENGKQIHLGAMRVPCRAEITYIRNKGRRLARRVVVMHTASDASALIQSEETR